MPAPKNEPVQRDTRSTPHVCAEIIRFGGERVFIVDGSEFSAEAYRGLVAADPDWIRGKRVIERVKNPEVYARGAVRHPDHSTLVLAGWHRVMLNREMTSTIRSSIAFYD